MTVQARAIHDNPSPDDLRRFTEEDADVVA